jgi:hypothetical protein
MTRSLKNLWPDPSHSIGDDDESNDLGRRELQNSVATKKRGVLVCIWLVVSTPLKNISQWEGLSHILWKIKNVPNHQPGIVYIYVV